MAEPREVRIDPVRRSAILIPTAMPAAAAVLGVLVARHTSGLNGPWFWKWPWRDAISMPALRWYPAMLAATAPIVIAMLIQPTSHFRRIVVLGLLCVGVFAMKLTSLAVVTAPPGFDMMEAIVRSPSATSYYTDAAAVSGIEGWLGQYAEFLPHLNLHTQSKPPGAVVFHLAMIRLFDYGRSSAVIGGILLAAIAALSAPAAYWLTSILTRDASIAIIAAITLSLCPGYVLIFPTFDACWPILSCAMIGTWHLTLTRRTWWWAIAFASVLVLSLFATYNLLVLGAFLMAWTICGNVPREDMPVDLKTAANILIAFATVLGLYALFWMFTAFDPIATFRSAYRNQQMLLSQHRDERPYPWTILFDLLDFLLGAGWIVVLPAMAALARFRDRHWRLIVLCIAQPVLVAVLGLLQSETARVWNFMLPLLLIPAAIELAGWSTNARRAVYLAMLGLLLIVGQNMTFMTP